VSAVAGIVLTELEKSYRTPTGPVRAVQGIDVTVAPGETVALLGPNGAGKSTTIDSSPAARPSASGSALRSSAIRTCSSSTSRRSA
jgi:ABC-2 type transport system ATP-binding protein